MEYLDWRKLFPGIWKATAGHPDDFTPLSVVCPTPAQPALEILGEALLPIPFDAIQIDSGKRRIVVSLPLEKDEKIYGLGLQLMSFNQRGRARYLRINSDPRLDLGETHAPVPFYISSQGYGLLVNTAFAITIHFGSSKKINPKEPAGDPLEQVEILLPQEGAELYLFAGPRMLDVVRRYNLFCGGGALPPRWGLGFWHRTNKFYTDRQVIDEVNEYCRRDIPLDVVGLEPGWETHSYPSTFEWDLKNFPDPGGFVDQIQRQGMKVNLWEHAYVSPQAKIFPRLLSYCGSHQTMGGFVPDLSLDEPRRILQEQHEQEHLQLGVSGYKLDECDGGDLCPEPWFFPAHAAYPSGHDGEQIRQVFGLMYQKLTYELFQRKNQRTYGLVRASNAAASSLPYVLYTDLYDHRQFVRALCNASFSGLLWTPEVREALSAEDWVRRIQVTCFSPLAQLNAWFTSVMPWSYPEVEPIVRKFIQLRMRLMPYFYTAFARYHFDGTPPFRAMPLEIEDPANPTSARGLTADDQYMAGDSLLVAPVFAGQTWREVFLPEGTWHDFETGQTYTGGQTIRVFPGLDKLPVFVKAGSIIPLMPPRLHAPRSGEAVPLEVRHYGNLSGTFRLYDDDGETFAYERGDYRWIELAVSVAPDGSRSGSVSVPETGWKSSYGAITWKYL